MGNSLQEQLLKAGLVDEKRVKQATKSRRKQKKAQHKGQAPAKPASPAGNALAEQAERDRELNRKREQKAQRKALEAKIRQLIETHRIAEVEGEASFNFQLKGKIKRLYVTPEIHQRLVSGTLAIALLQGRFELVPREIAERIAEDAPHRVVLIAPPEAEKPADENDPYADFAVPDDLMW